MNKTVNINLGNMLFVIDEDAYAKLQTYLEAVEKSLSPDSRREVMGDIEGRIAELFSEHAANKEVINKFHVDAAIDVMGQPEDYAIDTDYETQSFEDINSKRLRRDNSRRILGGVCAGLGRYLNTDPNIIRIIFILSGVGFVAYFLLWIFLPSHSVYDRTPIDEKKLYRDSKQGVLGGVCMGFSHFTGINKYLIRFLWVLFIIITNGAFLILYIILWILLPQPKTSVDRLKMMGERININNIEKKAKENINKASERIKNTDFKKVYKTSENAVANFFKVFGKIIGITLVVFLGILLLPVTAVLISFFTGGLFLSFSKSELIDVFIITEMPLGIIILAAFLVLVVPIIFLMIFGLQMASVFTQPVNKLFKYSLLSLWGGSIIICVFVGVNQVAQRAEEVSIEEVHELNVSVDTLYIHINKRIKKIKESVTFDTSNKNDLIFNRHRQNFMTLGDGLLYIGDVSLSVRVSESGEDAFKLLIEKSARGRDYKQSGAIVENILYEHTFERNYLEIDNYMKILSEDKYHGQEVRMVLYVPSNKLIKFDESVRDMYCRLPKKDKKKNTKDYFWRATFENNFESIRIP